MKITVSSPIEETPRVAILRGIFDLPPASHSALEWDVALDLPDQWNVGLIVGPSGCGKSTIARHLWPDGVFTDTPDLWPENRSLLDAFPEAMDTKEVAHLLSSVGFSSPPAWLRPYRVLSTGQKFRAGLALALATHTASPSPLVFDEFTSVVDRTVAKVGSAAAAKLVRKQNRQFIAVTCHDDVEDWLQPDWVYQPATNTLTRRLLRRRPDIHLDIVRCNRDAWPLFAPHHYLNTSLSRSAKCFLASWDGRPVCFSAWVHNFGTPNMMREHRTVTLPDYQGVGIGNAVANFCAGVFAAKGQAVVSTTTHPAVVQSRMRHADWIVSRRPNIENERPVAFRTSKKRAHTARSRFTVGFRYVGDPAPPEVAEHLLGKNVT